LGKGKILLTGEAAGFMYLNGEGISAALDSGRCAGIALAQALQYGSDALEIYKQNTAGIMRHMQKCRQQAHFLAG
jgi:flavin-dependent dehydrogenase